MGVRKAACYFLVAWLATGALSHGAGAQKTHSKGKPAPRVKQADESGFLQQVLDLTNRERVRNGLPPLKQNPELTIAAQWMARDLATNNYFAHEDHTGRNIDRRIPDFGYTGYTAIGENIAGGQATPAAVVNGWMHSPGHRANILSPEFREIGVGYVNAASSRYGRLWVQDFGAR